ncbi:MAG: 4Fe-4S binding protein [Anaerolineae bacterium]|nr:4Fe-4S binding protein [Anaerolineae bacterium]
MNLLRIALAAEKWTAGHPAITTAPELCLNVRDKDMGCRHCVDLCPTEAIALDPHVQLNPEACIHCGLCLHGCPTGVFEGDDGAYQVLHCITQLAEHDVIEIACPLHPSPATGSQDAGGVITTTGCLSMLGVSTYLGIRALGIGKTIVRLDACAECALCALQPKIEATIGNARQFLDQPDSIEIVTQTPSQETVSRPVYAANNPPVSRRRLFRMLASPEESSGEQVVSHFKAQPAEDDSRLPPERRRILASLRALQAIDPQASLRGQWFTLLQASGACTACGLCARICPTDALQFYETEEVFSLAFSAANCINCGLCVSLCEAQALQYSGSPTWADIVDGAVVTLRSGTLKHCKKCHVAFVGPDDYCPTCDFRRRNPFGHSILPRKSPPKR